MCAMRRLMIPLLLFLAVSACEEPLFDTPSRETPESGRNDPPPSAPDTTRAEVLVYATAIAFPDSVDWRAGDTRGAKLILFENEKAIGSLPVPERLDSDWHRVMDGHLWTYYNDGECTTIACDGSVLFSFRGQETLVGFLVTNGSVHTVGQHPGGGFTYRIDGQEVYSSAQGTVMGTSADTERQGGALSLDGTDIIYAYAQPVQGADDELLWEYRVMRGAEMMKSIPALSGVQLFDICVHDGEIYRLEYRYGHLCLQRGGNLTPLEVPEGSHSLRLTVVDGEVLVKGCHYDGWDGYYWLRDTEQERYQFYARWRYLYNLYVDDGELAAIVLDLDNCVVQVVRGDMEVNLNFETHRLHTARCVDYRKGAIALALTGDVDYNENVLLINDRKVAVPFNGYFTGVYLQ